MPRRVSKGETCFGRLVVIQLVRPFDKLGFNKLESLSWDSTILDLTTSCIPKILGCGFHRLPSKQFFNPLLQKNQQGTFNYVNSNLQ